MAFACKFNVIFSLYKKNYNLYEALFQYLCACGSLSPHAYSPQTTVFIQHNAISDHGFPPKISVLGYKIAKKILVLGDLSVYLPKNQQYGK